MIWMQGFYEDSEAFLADLRERDPFQWAYSVWDARNRSIQEWEMFLGRKLGPEVYEASKHDD